MTLIDDTGRTCVVHGRFRGPPLVTDTGPNAIAIGGKGTLTCRPEGLVVEARRVSQAGPATAFGIGVVALGTWLWWLHAEHGVSIDPEGLGPAFVAYTLIVGKLLRQWPTEEPLRLEIPWRSVASFRVRGRTITLRVRGFAPAGRLRFVAAADPVPILAKWKLARIMTI